MKIRCPHCGHEYDLPEKHLGRQAKCKQCGQTFTIKTEEKTKNIKRIINLSATTEPPSWKSVISATICVACFVLLSILPVLILAPVALCNTPQTVERNVSSIETAVEKLLKNYNPWSAQKTAKMIKGYKERKDTGPDAMTNVARTIFLMYGLNPNDITASYGGTKSKAVINKGNGKIRICVSERRNKNSEHHERAYGNDTFFHEMLHALGFKWKANGVVKTHGLSHSNSEEKKYFEKCRKILVSAIYGEKKEKQLRQKFDELLKNDNSFSGDEERNKQSLIRNYIKHRGRRAKTYSRAKRFHPLLAIQNIHSLGLPLDAEYVDGYFDGKKTWVVKIHVGSSMKKYKPDMNEMYHDDVIRAIDKQIKIIHDELKTVRRGEYPKEKMIDYLNTIRFEKFKMRYWYRFIRNQDIEIKLPKL